MRVFETGINGHHKLNFVDDNNIFVCFDYYVNCCEIFDYKITESEPQTYEHLEKVPANNVYDFPGYNFDVSYKQELFEADGGEGGFNAHVSVGDVRHLQGRAGCDVRPIDSRV